MYVALGGLGLAAVPHDGLEQCACTSVVEIVRWIVDHREEPYSPEWRGAPLRATGQVVWPAVGEICTHIMQQQVAVWVYDLI